MSNALCTVSYRASISNLITTDQPWNRFVRKKGVRRGLCPLRTPFFRDKQLHFIIESITDTIHGQDILWFCQVCFDLAAHIFDMGINTAIVPRISNPMQML